MKIDPLNIVLKNYHKIDKPFYLITGNELTLMERVREELITTINKLNDFSIEKIKNISFIKKEVSLFNEKRLYIIKDASGLEASVFEHIGKNNDVFIFQFENSPKLKSIKNVVSKRNDFDVFECYELTKENKGKVVKKYLEDFNIQIDTDLFWNLVDGLDNKFMFLENEIKKLQELKNTISSKDFINKGLSKNNMALERLFFKIFGSNEDVVKTYNQKVTNVDDVRSLYYITKQFALLIINNENVYDFEKNIPKYLFREKKFLINMFNKYNANKKRVLLNLLFKTEKTIRKHGKLSVIMGLRFLLNFKKISTS